MRKLGYLMLAAFVACVVIANYAVTHWGDAPAFPGGPHTVTVLGLTAPSAVLVVGLSFTVRDLAQTLTNKRAVLAAICVGAILSWLIGSKDVAVASALAFAVSETLDLAVYSPLAERGRWMTALVASNTVGAVIDSVLFLWIAFGWSALADFLWPQTALKWLMILPAVIVLAPIRLRRTWPAS